MRVLEMFCGLGGWGKPFMDRGHEVVTTDIDPVFGCTITADVLDLDVVTLEAAGKGGHYDLIPASPPCECFSVASIGTHWGMPYYTPKSARAQNAIKILEHTLELASAMLNTPYFILENPRGVMRKMACLQAWKRQTVTYCQYGDTRMKPTDLWGYFPPSLDLKPMCKNGDPCHERAPRGAKTGTQGIKGYANRSLIPYDLAMAVCIAAESDLEMYGGKRMVKTLGWYEEATC